MNSINYGFIPFRFTSSTALVLCNLALCHSLLEHLRNRATFNIISDTWACQLWKSSITSQIWHSHTSQAGAFTAYCLFLYVSVFCMCVQCIYLPAPVYRSKRTGVQCFYTGSGCPALPVCPAAAAPRPAGRTAVCHTPEEDCGCTAARVKQGWHAHTAGGRPVSRCPWPVGSCPGCTEDLRHGGYSQSRDRTLLWVDWKSSVTAVIQVEICTQWQ